MDSDNDARVHQPFENGCSENSTQKLLTKYSTEENNKHVICRPRSVRIGKHCALGLAYSRPLAQFFPIRTSRTANNIYVLNNNYGVKHLQEYLNHLNFSHFLLYA